MKLGDIVIDENSSENLFSAKAKQALIDLEIAREHELNNTEKKQNIEYKCNNARDILQKSQNTLSF